MADSKELDPSLVTVGQPTEGGCCYVYFGTPDSYPSDATTAMSTASGFASLGELSENGFTESKSVSSTTHKGWHGDVLLATNDDVVNTFKMEFLEINRGTVAKVRYGADNVELNDDGSVKSIVDGGVNNDELCLVIDELESNG